jgi:hypothetical protein
LLRTESHWAPEKKDMVPVTLGVMAKAMVRAKRRGMEIPTTRKRPHLKQLLLCPQAQHPLNHPRQLISELIGGC